MESKFGIKKQIQIQQFAVYDKISQLDHLHLKGIEISNISDQYVEIKEEYIEGKTLKEIISEKKVPKRKIYNYIIQLTSALEVLHLNEIVHRDIKPENIVIGEDEILRIIDYDIARIYKENKNSDTTLYGTQGYAPPEQFGFSQSDFRSDIYALGVVLDELNCAFNLSLTTIVQKCRELDPAMRYQKTSELRLDIFNQVEKVVYESLKQPVENDKKIDEQKNEPPYDSEIKESNSMKKYLIEFKNELNRYRNTELVIYFIFTCVIYDVYYDIFEAATPPIIYLRILIILYICFVAIAIKLLDKYRWNRPYLRWILWFLSYGLIGEFYEFILKLGGF